METKNHCTIRVVIIQNSQNTVNAKLTITDIMNEYLVS